MKLTGLTLMWLCAVPMLVQGQIADSLCLRLRGTFVNYVTHQPLDSVRLMAKTAKGWQNVTVRNDSNAVSGLIPCGTKVLYVERVGYRTQIIPIQSATNQAGQPVTIRVPLLPTDKPGRNVPYMQTEQTSYVQSDTSTKQSKDTSRIQHDTFLISDATTGEPLPATICFFYTKTGKKRCLSTNVKGLLQLAFTQQDIVALEVRAAGYQPYDGNLLVEQLTGQFLQHTIRLQRELTLLSVYAPASTRCELRTKNKSIDLLAIPGRVHEYTMYELAPGTYDLVVGYDRKTTIRPVRISRGLNVVAVNQQPSATILATAGATTAPDQAATDEMAMLTLPDSIPMIYFEQGSYQLRPDSQDVLRQVARYMKGHSASTLQITGHTDNVGNPQINQTLSTYRALVTASFLAKLGIADHLLTKEGIGSRQPIAPNDTESNRALNRRVSLKLTMAQ